MKPFTAVLLVLSLFLTVGCTKDDDPVSPADPVPNLVIMKNAKEYLRYRYFYIDNSFKDNMAAPGNYTRLLEHEALESPQYTINQYSFELYVTRTVIGTQQQADIYIDHLNPDDSIHYNDQIFLNKYCENRNVKLVPDSLYDINCELGYLRLSSFYLASGDILAVKYLKQNLLEPHDTIEIGDVDSTGTKLELQILGEYWQRYDEPWYGLEWKNVYSMNAGNLSGYDVKLTIQNVEGEYIKTEEYDNSNVLRSYLYWFQVNDPDTQDKVDDWYFNPYYGEFMFPNLTPFDPDLNSIIYSEGLEDSLYTDPYIYTEPFYPSMFILKFELFEK